MVKTVKTSNPSVISSALIKRKKNRRKANKGKKREKRGIVYIRHLPHGFEEPQLREYFQQFGQVTKIRLARSKKTLNPKGYAFVEFQYPEVAEIAADAMNNYIMFKQVIKTIYIPPESIRYNYFRSGIQLIKKGGKTVMTSTTIQAREAIKEANNRLMTDEDKKRQNSAVSKKIQKAKDKLESLGINFDLNQVTKNLDESIKNPPKASKKQKITLGDLPLDDTVDEDDETFDPEKFDLDSNDSFDDYEYDSAHTEDEELDNLNQEDELMRAVEKAKKATELQKKLEKENPPAKEISDSKIKKTKASKKKKGKGKSPEESANIEAEKPIKTKEDFLTLKSDKKLKAKLDSKIKKKKSEITEKPKVAVNDLKTKKKSKAKN